jgi:dipeptidase D
MKIFISANKITFGKKSHMSEVAQLEPTLLWKNFADLNAVPRPSKEEEKVIAFMQGFGKRLKLETNTDSTGNVLIKKPATEGMEDKETVILQSHLDMVHQKNNDTDFDFKKEGIRMKVEGDWVKAEGTTLGADNGIGVATIMALLESTDIEHPALEALFTVDEETGMTGAFGLEPGFLSGGILLNLDTEDDDELTIGCAGGINVTARGTFHTDKTAHETEYYRIKLKGLSGGHSGMDIHKGLGNANKLMNRLLYQLYQHVDYQLCRIEGGNLRNAIPRESEAVIALNPADKDQLEQQLKGTTEHFQQEYQNTDPGLTIQFEIIEEEAHCADAEFTEKFLKAIYAIPNGIYRMSPSVEGMVQTSNNLAKVKLAEGRFEILCLCRSSVDSEKMDEVEAIKSALSILGAEINTDGDYPGWTPKPSSEIVEIMSELYRKKFNEEPRVMACHAGLECGIIGSHYPEMDMVSFGPNIRGAHSPDEKVQISSVQKFWDLLLDTLKQIPEKK